MRNPLFKRIPRNIKRDFVKHIGLFTILAVTIIAGTSFAVTLDSVTKTLEINDEKCLVEDGEFETNSLISDSTKNYFSDGDITLATDFYYTEDGIDDNFVLLIFDEKDKLNIPVIFEGRFPKSDDEIVFDRLALEHHGLKIGDTVKIREKDFVITGTAAFTDYTSLFKNNSNLVMDNDGFGVSMVSHEGFDRINLQDEITYRYSYRFNERDMSEKELFEANSDISKMLLGNQEEVSNFLVKDDNQSITFLSKDMGSDGPMMKVFVYILELIIAFIFVILTSDCIESESGIIGTLRALGYKKSEIVIHYLAPTFIVTCAAALAGNALGYTVMLDLFKNLYYTTYSVAPIEVTFSAGDFLVSTVVPIVIVLAVNYLMLISKLTLSPLRFLRGDIKRGRRKKAVKLPNVGFFSRFRLRIILENKINYLILFAGIFLASFLLLFGIGFEPMFDRYESKIDKSLNYEYMYLLKAPLEVDGGEKITVAEMKTYYAKAQKDIEVQIYGINEESEYFAAKELPEYENEIIISTQVAGKLGIGTDDSLILKDSKHDKEYKFYVTDVCEHESSMAVFMERDLLNGLLDREEGYFNAYVSNEKMDIDESVLARTITRKDMIGAASQMIESFEVVIEFVKWFSVLIYFVLMYVLTKVVVEKNALSIAYLKVFGYNNKEIGKVYLNASILTVVASLLLCIPLEQLSLIAVMEVCTQKIESFVRFEIPVNYYILVVVIGLVTFFAVNAIHVSRIRRIPAAQALKNRE